MLLEQLKQRLSSGFMPSDGEAREISLHNPVVVETGLSVSP